MAVWPLLSFLVNALSAWEKNTSLDYMLGAAVNLHQGLPPSAWNKMISNSRDFEIEIWSSGHMADKILLGNVYLVNTNLKRATNLMVSY